jgi:hypothetical protein
VAVTETFSAAEQSARRLMAIAATLGVVGIAFNLNGDGTLPKVLAGAGIIALVWSIHRYGRLGPDAPIAFSAPEPEEGPRKKKKKKKKVAAEAASTDGRTETPPSDTPPGESETNDGM